MDLSVASVAEKLSRQFAEVRIDRVISVLTDCAGEHPHADSFFIEQAARARLLRLVQPWRDGSRAAGEDALDVSLHDFELAVEVELTARLMVAANGSDQPLAEEDVDRILEVPERERMLPGSVVPSQRTAREGHQDHPSTSTRSVISSNTTAPSAASSAAGVRPPA
jgi:hypothetical protein